MKDAGEAWDLCKEWMQRAITAESRMVDAEAKAQVLRIRYMALYQSLEEFRAAYPDFRTSQDKRRQDLLKMFEQVKDRELWER